MPVALIFAFAWVGRRLHRLLGDDEGARDLLGREASQGPQRQRNLCLDGTRRMAAGEAQLEPLVLDRAVVEVDLVHGPGQPIVLEQPALGVERPLAPQAVDGAVAPGGHEPGHRVLRRPVTRPPLGRDREGLLRGFLGEIHVTEDAAQGSQDAASLAPERTLDQKPSSVGTSTNGRTSTAPPSRIVGIRWANSNASSRSAPSST